MSAMAFISSAAAVVVVLTILGFRYGLNLRDCRRVLRTTLEFIRAYWILQGVGPSVTFFSSARLKPDSKSYKLLEACAFKFAQRGFSVFHGAGPGGMEAVAKGAQAGAAVYRANLSRAKASVSSSALPKSIGLAIHLPFEQKPNEHCDISITFHNFFTRKVCLVRYSQAIVIGLGGYGTLDETFEALTLMQCQHHASAPVYLLDCQLAQPLLKLVGELYSQGVISRSDVERLVLVGEQDTCGLPVRCLANDEEMLEEIETTSRRSLVGVPSQPDGPAAQPVNQAATA